MTATAGQIGPNALLQLLPVLAAEGGPDLARDLFAAARAEVPDPALGLVPEAPVARVHRGLRVRFGARSEALLFQAGLRTADYILAHRIPKPAQTLLRWLPPALGGPVLARAIAQNAWTFAGSGRFAIAPGRPPRFDLADNPLIRGEQSSVPLCHWHRAVFERLFRALIDDRLRCQETACCATGARACRFALVRQ